MNERRHSERVPVALRAHYRSADVVGDGVVEDLSRTGLFLRTTSIDELGRSAHVDLDLPESGTVRVAGEVVRILDGDRRGMGIRFESMDGEVRRSLANFLMHWSHWMR